MNTFMMDEKIETAKKDLERLNNVRLSLQRSSFYRHQFDACNAAYWSLKRNLASAKTTAQAVAIGKKINNQIAKFQIK